MRRPSVLRCSLAFCGSLLLWMAGVSVADAAPVHRLPARGAEASDAQITVRRPHPKPVVKSARRPISQVIPIRMLVRRHVTGWLQPSGARPMRDIDAAAIQNGAAVGPQDDHWLRASLEPLGLLAAPQREIVVSETVARRAPRGPPVVTLS